MAKTGRVVKTGRRVVRLHIMQRPPRALKKLQERGYRILVGEFAPAFSEATRFSGVAGKRKRWYVVKAGKRFELYDKRGKYYGTYTKTELFNGNAIEIQR